MMNACKLRGGTHTHTHTHTHGILEDNKNNKGNIRAHKNYMLFSI